MKSYLFLGDTHGDIEFVERVAVVARQHDAEVVQVGDWGFLWPGSDKLKDLSDLLLGCCLTMRFCDGNHDDHPRLRKLALRGRATEIARNVIYQPRGSVHEDEDGTRLLFLGGAPSIDRAFRTKGRSWWPEEVIEEDEASRARAAKKPVHALVTHDAPGFPPGFASKGSPSYQAAQKLSMQRVDMLVKHHRPDLHVHGHWHSRYERRHATGARVVGLDCNLGRVDAAVLLWSRSEEETK